MQRVLAMNGCAVVPASLFPTTEDKLSPVFKEDTELT